MLLPRSRPLFPPFVPVAVAPAIGLTRLRRLPPFVGPDDPPHHQGDDAQADKVEDEGLAAGPGEQRPGDEQGDRYRNRSPLVPLDEADDANRRSLELDESVLDAHTHLLGFVNDVGKRVCRPAPDALRPGTDTAMENAGLG